jgi:hypothetical protein
MRAKASFAFAGLILAITPIQAEAGWTRVCQDVRGYTYSVSGQCRNGDRTLDRFREIRWSKSAGGVVSTFREGQVVVEYGGSEQCSLYFDLNSPWVLLADFVTQENQTSTGLIFGDFGTPRFRDLEFFAVTNGDVVVRYHFADLLVMATEDRCHGQGEARRYVHR